MPFFIFFIVFFGDIIRADKCYSCSSPQLHLKWPKDSNRLLYFQNFPVEQSIICETLRGPLPVVDCPDSVCIKAVIKNKPAERTVCETGGAIVRDCWTNVVSSPLLNPRARREMVRLTETIDSNSTIGVIYTCQGFLCNSSPTHFSSISLSFLIFFIGFLL